MLGKLQFESSKTGSKIPRSGDIFGTTFPKPVKDKGILWAPPYQVEVKCPPTPQRDFNLLFNPNGRKKVFIAHGNVRADNHQDDSNYNGNFCKYSRQKCPRESVPRKLLRDCLASLVF